MTRQPRQPTSTALLAGRAALVLAAGIVVAGCLPTGGRTAAPSGRTPSNGGAIAATPIPTPAGPTPRPSFVRPTPTPVPTLFVYTVASGDNLNTIARRFGTTARSIAFWNRATYPSLDPLAANYRPDLLQLGWTLFVRPHDVFDEQDLADPSEAPTESPSDSAPTG